MNKDKNKTSYYSGGYYKSVNKDFILTDGVCKDCNRDCQQKWIAEPAQCNWCAIDDVKKLKIEISEKDLIIENLKNKLKQLKIKEVNKATVESEVIETNENDSHSESNYSLVEEQVENNSSNGLTGFYE